MANIIKVFRRSLNDLAKYYKFLIDKKSNNEYIEIVNEKFINNYHLLSKIQKKVSTGNQKIIKQYYYFLKSVVNRKNYNLSFEYITDELIQYQNRNKKNFSYKELNIIFYTLIIIYIEKLNNLCRAEYQKLVDREDVARIIKANGKIEIENILADNFDISNNSYFIFELNNQLTRIEKERDAVFKELNEYLQKKSISLKELINEEIQKQIDSNILISNIFNSLKELFTNSLEDLYTNVSKVERLLLDDSIYKNMTIESKEFYRKQITRQAKKKHLDDYSYLKKIFQKDEHIGFKLFQRKSPIKIISIIYIIVSFLISFVISILLSRSFIKNQILGFLILFIPIIQVIKKLISILLNPLISKEFLPRLDYSKKIPKESQTMLAITTIIKSKEQIREIFTKLETLYLVNKTDNLYFTLLGDVSKSSTRIAAYDDEISKSGKEYAEELNKKYKKDIFYFLYRKRVYDKSNKCYLGYEGKSGALLQLNKILLGEYIDLARYFNVNMLHKNNLDIKYIITLDPNVTPTLDFITKLVGTMAHPLNKPILDKKGTRIRRGHALLQSKVVADITSETNFFKMTSIIISQFYKSFINKNSLKDAKIYDLKAFNKLFDETLIDNVIISSDLLERNYLQAAYVSDIKVFATFSKNFFTNTKKQYNQARDSIRDITLLGNKVKIENEKKIVNYLSIIGKYEIISNIIQLFLEPMLLTILILSFFGITKNSFFWILFVIITITTPIFSVVFCKNRIKDKIKNALIYPYIAIATIPYYTQLYMITIFKTIYGLGTHKNLFQIASTEEEDNLKNYIYNFIFNLILGIILIGIGFLKNNFFFFILAVIFITTPFVLYKLKLYRAQSKYFLSKKKETELKELSTRIWEFFDDNLKDEYNYLIPYNYQENKEKEHTKKTTPLAIGYSLTSTISAYELEIITKEKALFLIDKILRAVDNLKKWHGHLYSWYNIENEEVLNKYIRTNDSGIFLASLIVTQEFLKKHHEDNLALLCQKLIANMNFKKLSTEDNILSIGYDDNIGKLTSTNHNSLISPTRLTGYIAISLGALPKDYWQKQKCYLTSYKAHKGLISEEGTAIDYYLPTLFMQTYKNTILDEAANFAHFCQKKYVNKFFYKLPWGISESGYNEFDDNQDYKYKTFYIPCLRMQKKSENRIILSPYSSIMALEFFPKDIFNNIQKFKRLNMYSKYGLYDAYDYESKEVIQTYFTTHQGMSLLGLTNYLKKDIIKNYFCENTNIKAYNLLLKERTKDLKIRKYQKNKYFIETDENTISSIRQMENLPEMAIISNKNYSLIMDDRGNSFSRYRTLQLNRYRKMTTASYGIFLFIKDLKTDYIWSNTYAPMNVIPDKYEVLFEPSKIKYIRQDEKIVTKTEITICSDYHAEIRKITFKNNSNTAKKLELTSYTEPIICNNFDDIDNKVFNSMFINTEYNKELNTLIAERKNKKEANLNNYMFVKFIIKEPLEDYTYETERENIIGRNKSLNTAQIFSRELTNYSGDNLDPVLSLRNKIHLPANTTISVYLLVGFDRNKKKIYNFLKKYNSIKILEEEFKKSVLTNSINIKSMNLTKTNITNFHKILSYLYQEKYISITNRRTQILKQNSIGQDGLWKFGISGKLPIITIKILDIKDMNFIYEILKLFEYYKNKSVYIDVIIINGENTESQIIINKNIEEELYRIYTMNSFYNTPGKVTIINEQNLKKEDKNLLKTMSKLFFIIENHINLKDYLKQIENSLQIIDYNEYIKEDNIAMPAQEKLTFDNYFGGFKNNGKEYVIYNKNTPMPWSNIIANKNFGTIVTNNGCGYTYAYNSKKFKVTSPTSETLIAEKSEGFIFDGKLFEPEKCTHSFGYSILESETTTLSHNVTEFVSLNDNIKLYLLKVKNKAEKQEEVQIEFFIKPVLGDLEDFTISNILTEYIEKNNYLKLKNVCSLNYAENDIFISASETIKIIDLNKLLEKKIGFNVSLAAKEEKTIVFTLGCSQGDKNIVKLLNKYMAIENTEDELEKVKNYWNNLLKKVQVSTPDESFNYMINGWYLYQTISSSILSKTDFYQVGEENKYKKQLQDAVNIILIKPGYTREQILIGASHQFEKGDTLHWWNEQNHYGLRSRYTDDHLWLIYATTKYIEVTGDYKILEEKAPYVIGEELSDYENGKELVFYYSEKQDSILEHCLKSLNFSMASLGIHKIPLIGNGDLNEDMNLVGIKGRGESVLLGFFLHIIIERFNKILNKYQKDFDFIKYINFNEELRESINTKTWDGKHYLRAFYDNGDKLGSHESKECKIDLLSQSFALMSSIVPKNRIQKIIASVEDQLVEQRKGIIKLLTPAFSETLNNPGDIMNYPKGINENGGQQTYAVSWYLKALIQRGYHHKAYQYYQMINPINRTKAKKEVEIYKVEPYVIADNINDSEKFQGQGNYSWYTNSSSLLYNIGIEDVLGIKKVGNELKIEPAIPDDWHGYEVTYHYLDTTYNIEVHKGLKNYKKLDNKIISSPINLENDGLDHELIISISKEKE